MQAPPSMVKALADGNRLRVIAALREHEELCVCQITELLHLATATVSRHMSILQYAGLVQSRKKSRWVYYRLTAEFPTLLGQWLTRELAGSAQIQSAYGSGVGPREVTDIKRIIVDTAL